MAGEQPKKPVGGAYGVFLAEKRPEFTKACAGKKASEISKMAGAEWKKMTETQKAPYQKKYEAKSKTYEEEMKKFLEAGGVKQKGLTAMRKEKREEKEGKKKKPAKDPNKPKKPAGGAYGVFLAQNRAELMKKVPKGSAVTAVSKLAGAEWKALSEAKKKPYEEAYKKKKEEFEAAMKEYKANGGGVDDDEDVEEEEEEEEVAETKPSPSKKAKKA